MVVVITCTLVGIAWLLAVRALLPIKYMSQEERYYKQMYKVSPFSNLEGVFNYTSFLDKDRSFNKWINDIRQQWKPLGNSATLSDQLYNARILVDFVNNHPETRKLARGWRFPD